MISNDNQSVTKPEPGSFSVWGPRVLITLSTIIAVFLMIRVERFDGKWDDTFLAEENLQLIRGPLAKREYYEKGLPDYQSKSLFGDEDQTVVGQILSATEE